MIGTSSRGSSFSGLINYLEYGNERDDDREGFVGVRNLPNDDPEVAAKIMKATSKLSKRVKKPVYHLILAWHETDKISPEDMVHSADSMLKHLGLEDHQVYMKEHLDKDYPHMHLAINRVHPETGRAWRGDGDRYDIRNKCMELEQRNDWVKTQKYGKTRGMSIYDMEIGKRTGDDKGREMSKTDEQKLREDLTHTMSTVTDWKDLESRLDRRGLELKQARAGIRIYRGGRYAKFSKLLPPKINAKKMHNKLGSFKDYMKDKTKREARLNRKRERQRDSDRDDSR